MKTYTFKKESLEEYKARGGVVTKCPPVKAPHSASPRRVKSSGASSIMTLEEGDLFYGEKTKRSKKSKKIDKKEVDELLTFLPEEMRKKLGF